MTTRRGDFFFTSSGVRFWPLDPRPEEVLIGDIAHALGNVCRFGGHCQANYSVAQHSVLVSNHCPPALKLQGLLHDATEAYLGDMVHPLKVHMPDFREAEYRLWMIIAEKWNLPLELDPLVKELDGCALMTEQRDLTHPNFANYDLGLGIYGRPFTDKITPWLNRYASGMFLLTFRELTEGRAVA